MEDINKYWYVSWGRIFDILDREAHRVAIEHIWECVTANSYINFHNSMESEENYKFDYNIKNISERKLEIYIWIKTDRLIATANLLFIKLKSWNPTN